MGSNTNITQQKVELFVNYGLANIPAIVYSNIPQILVVGGAGGGGGGAGFGGAGGGGAGRVVYTTTTPLTLSSYAVVIGAGGTGATGGGTFGSGNAGGNGQNSSFGGLTAGGGGGGAGKNGAAGDGGSGGGGTDSLVGHTTAGTGTPPGGNDGGTGNGFAGGGGGAGATGGAGNGIKAGDGGIGIAPGIAGSTAFYGGGGGGCFSNTIHNGAGGIGGGGNGSNTAGVSGTPNTGGGGGAAYSTGGLSAGNGGSGVVIVAYHTDGSDGILPTSTGGTKTTFGLYTVHTFTSNGTFTPVYNPSVPEKFFPGWTGLDLSPDEPIKITLSVQDMFDVTRSSSDFTQTFRLKHTPNNGQFFKTAYNVNGYDYNASIVVPAYFNINGSFFRSGNIQLSSVYNNYKDNTIEYEVIFLGSTADFSTNIGQAPLSYVNLGADYGITGASATLVPNIGGTVFGNDLTNALTVGNIVTSWGATGATTAGGLLTPNQNYGDIVYPLIEWGYDYDSTSGVVTTQGTISLRGLNSFTNGATTNKLSYTQFKPSIRARALWDAIFKNSGYTYQSGFLSSSAFLKQYIITDNIARSETNLKSSFLVQTKKTSGYFNTPVPLPLPFNSFPTNVNDNNVFNSSLNEFIVPVTGTYNFFIISPGATPLFINNGYPSVLGCTMSISLNNTTTPYSIGLTADGAAGCSLNTFSPAISEGSIPLTLTAGDIVKLNFQMFPTLLDPCGQIFVNPVQWGVDSYPPGFPMSSFLPSDKLQIDFIKGISDRFKLVFIPDTTNPYNFLIEPWQTWIATGSTSSDWTGKLDLSKDFQITPAFYTNKRGLEFVDPQDQDYVNFNYNQQYKYPYGYFKLDSGIQLLKDITTISDIFSPTPLNNVAGSSGGTGTWLVPHIAKSTVGNGTTTINKIEPIKPLLRLLNYNGLINLEYPEYEWHLFDQTGGTTNYTHYPLMSTFDSWGATAYSGIGATANDLNWISPTPVYLPDVINSSVYTTNTITSNTAFTNYWQTWYNAMYDPYSRTATAYFRLDWNDVYNLKFNNRIWIRDAWWYVTKIYDWILGDVSVVKVDLLKLNNFNTVE